MAGVQQTVALVRAGSPRRVLRGYGHVLQHWDGGGLGVWGQPGRTDGRAGRTALSSGAHVGASPSPPRRGGCARAGGLCVAHALRRRPPRAAPRPRRAAPPPRVGGAAAALAAANALCGAPPAWGPPQRPRRGAPATPPPRAAASRRPRCAGGRRRPRPTGARTARASTEQAATPSVRGGLDGGHGMRPPRAPGAVGTPRLWAPPSLHDHTDPFDKEQKQTARAPTALGENNGATVHYDKSTRIARYTLTPKNGQGKECAPI